MAGAVGLPGALAAGRAPLGVGPAVVGEDLRESLRRWRDEALPARDWPGIVEAWTLARAEKGRELVEMDGRWTIAHGAEPFADASRAVGRRQLGKLRPLRDVRAVQRYLAAIDRGDAQGWHPIVFGVVTAVFNLPLRPALLSYATSTLEGFVQAAAGPLGLREPQAEALASTLVAALPLRLAALPELGAAVLR